MNDIPEKYYANRGVNRTKKPLQNIILFVKLIDFEKIKAERADAYEKYKFKDLGYIWVDWQYEKDWNKGKLGLIMLGCQTPEQLKKRLGEKQWAKFCTGKREFVIQRRENGINIKKQNRK